MDRMKPLATQTYLHTTSLQFLENWSVQYLLDSKFSYSENFELVLIGTFFKRNKTFIEIENDIEYKRVTIKINNGGVYLRDKEIGKNIGTKKQFLIKQGQFLLSKIDARNGAFGVVPKEIDNAIITGNFWSFDVDYTLINPHFLALITTTSEFIRFSENASNGTTNRHYLQEDLFLAQKIPLPSLSDQNRIVEAYNVKIKLAEEQINKAEKLEKSISTYIDSELGIQSIVDNIKTDLSHYLKLINYSTLDKWGFDQQISSSVTYSKEYPIKKIKEVCTVSSGGTPSRSRKDFYTGNIPWVKTAEVLNDIIVNSEEKITQEAIENSSAKLYPKGSLIIAMYGQGATRGRTAKLGIDASTNQACAVLFEIDNSLIDTDYLWVYLMNEYDRLRALASGNNQPNLNAQMIKDYKVIIPPFDIQKKIKDVIGQMKYEIKKLIQQAENYRIQAIKEFENEIVKL